MGKRGQHQIDPQDASRSCLKTFFESFDIRLLLCNSSSAVINSCTLELIFWVRYINIWTLMSNGIARKSSGDGLLNCRVDRVLRGEFWRRVPIHIWVEWINLMVKVYGWYIEDIRRLIVMVILLSQAQATAKKFDSHNIVQTCITK